MAKQRRGRIHTPGERALIVERIKEEMATGATLRAACLKAGSYPSQFRYWSKTAPAPVPAPAKSNGETSLSWSAILTIDGTRHHLSLEDARIIHEGLSALISKP